MEKVKVSKSVAHALDVALKVMDKEKFFEERSNKMVWQLDIYLPLNEISNWEMAQILINGYEVEETKEDKILKAYKLWDNIRETAINGSFDKGYAMGFMGAAECILNDLEIKIKGIND